MVLKIYTDGGSKGNPGPASIGLVFHQDGKTVFKHKESIGIATNNDAEYIALIRALEYLPRYISGATKVEFYSDSRLMVNQVRGLFKVKNGKIKEYILKIRGLEQQATIPISYHLIPREENYLADRLVNEA